MILRFRPIEVWPGPKTTPRKPAPFEASWSDTLELLERELRAVQVRWDSIVLQVALRESDLRLDGQPRASARDPEHPGVILSFDSQTRGPLSFPCDTFTKRSYRAKLEGWQANVRAIALGLEALRKIERYGIANTGQQYTGWKQLGGGTPMPAATMTIDEAARFIAAHADLPGLGPDDVPWPQLIIAEPEALESGYRRAAKRLHPDAGGDAGLFRRLVEARDVLARGR